LYAERAVQEKRAGRDRERWGESQWLQEDRLGKKRGKGQENFSGRGEEARSQVVVQGMVFDKEFRKSLMALEIREVRAWYYDDQRGTRKSTPYSGKPQGVGGGHLTELFVGSVGSQVNII